MKKKDCKYLIYGLRKKSEITQKELGNIIGSTRRAIGRYEDGTRIPNIDKVNKLLKLISENKYNEKSLIKYGKSYFFEVERRYQSKKLELEYSEKLAELIGIIIGDGCVQKDGTIIIAFHKKNDSDFIQRMVKPLIENLLNKRSFVKYVERTNTGVLTFYSKSFTKFLESKCNIKPGNKIKNQTTIPAWCFQNKKCLSAVLRGIFDTDGFFERNNKKNSSRIEIRISNRCIDLTKDIRRALEHLRLQSSLKQDVDGNSIRIHSRKWTILFFKTVGSSNIKHISRFLLWRYAGENSKIKREGASGLIDRVNNLLCIDCTSLKLPFIWRSNDRLFNKYVEEDERFLKNYEIRKEYKWSSIFADLIKKGKNSNIANTLSINPRSVRAYREGRRIPNVDLIPTILYLVKKYDLSLEKYKENE